MTKSPIKKLFFAALLAASLGSFLYLQEMNRLPEVPATPGLSLVEEQVEVPQSNYFPHIQLVKKVLDVGYRVFKVGL